MPQETGPSSSKRGGGWLKAEWSTRLLEPGPGTPTPPPRLRLGAPLLAVERQELGFLQLPPAGLAAKSAPTSSLPDPLPPGGQGDRAGGRRAEQRTCGHEGPLQDQGKAARTRTRAD